ncbi:hypothetical protein OJ997_22385 [Solirubrobacter phytolaccae]|uniref:Uncharacterized protein n=1 Tax=Solirubrobacter phytolaccae TaxID=1404360 RepID=A0A9X3NBJ7_9ACTN|nr:hypothetical protein [Solirubrobacter phytolaccae]MDA0183074.1 hypothetical protein [Solirubrobacter phytolaccae]
MKRALAFVCMFALVATALVASPGLALTMAPALLLLALLAGGFRPGEALIERLRDRRRPAVALPRAVSMPRPRLALIARPTAGPAASALAMRPPPSAFAVTT